VLSTATALPALGARPVPVLNQGIQRLIPLTARGPGAGFGGPGAGSPESPLVLGGPFRPVERGLLTVEVTIEADAPAPANLYLRGIARPVYTGSALETAAPYTLKPGLPLQRLPETLQAVRVEQWIRHEDFRSRLLYGAHLVRSVGLPGGGPVFADADGSLYGPGPLRSGDRYRVVSEMPRLDAEGLRRLLEPPPTGYPDVDAIYLQLPESLPDRVRDLALRITADAASPYQAARNIETFLRRFPYHEDTPFTPPGRDFVDYFLFDLQTGYCTYYTSAMVVMLRAAGIPARAVEGFILPLQGSGRYEVTGAQAHTWVEAYMPHYGWLTFEPTPAYPASPAAPPAGSLTPEGAGDPSAPDLLDPRAPLPGLDPGLMPGLDDLAPVVSGGSPAGNRRPGSLTALLLVTGTLGAAAAAVAFRRRAVWRRSSPADRIRRHYLHTRRLLGAALAHAGAGPNRESLTPPAAAALTPPAAAALTPAELAAWGGRVWPALADSLQALTGLYHDAAYGPPARRPDDAAARKTEEAVRAVAAGLRAQIGWARYLKAVLKALLTALLPSVLPRPLAGQPR
ncbi:MAG TPA: transglutaminase domain-containing protein, partial [Bacillota bacterium]